MVRSLLKIDTPTARRGATAGEVVFAIALMVGVVGGAALVGPAMLRASPQQSRDIIPEDPTMRASFEAVRAFFETNHQVLSDRVDTVSGLYEVVLWNSDQSKPGTIQPGEIIVLTHSAFLGTLTATVVLPEDENLASQTIEPETAGSRAFAQSWREHPAQSSFTLAQGVGRFRLDGPDGQKQGGELLVRLTYTGKSSEEPMVECAFVSSVTDSRGIGGRGQ